MNSHQVEFLQNLAKSKEVDCRYTFGLNYCLTFVDGTTYSAPYYDCLKKLGYYNYVH